MSRSASPKQPSDPKIQQMKLKAKEMTNHSKQIAAHILYESLGEDPNKKKRNGKGCDRGTSSGVARSCSTDYRQVYGNELIRDDLQNSVKAEFCVCGKHQKPCCLNHRNACKLCFIENDRQYQRITNAEGFAQHTKLIMNSYPSNHSKVKRKSILRIKVDGELWLVAYLKLAPFSSLLKTASPSGYKYRDRNSMGKMIKMQGMSNRDLVFYVTKSPNYVDAERETERPMVNAVGFWGFMDDTENIRHIIQLHDEQAEHVCFGFFVKKESMNSIGCIQVDLESSKDGRVHTETIWQWSPNSNSMHINHDDQTNDILMTHEMDSTHDVMSTERDDDDEKTEYSNSCSFSSENALQSPQTISRRSSPTRTSSSSSSPCTHRDFQPMPLNHGVRRKGEAERNRHKRQSRADRVDQRVRELRRESNSSTTNDDHRSDSNHSSADTTSSSTSLTQHVTLPLRQFMHFVQEIDTLKKRVETLESQRAFVPYGPQYFPPPQNAYPPHGVAVNYQQQQQQQHVAGADYFSLPAYCAPPALPPPHHHHHQHPTATTNNSDHSMSQSPTTSAVAHTNSPQSPTEHQQMTQTVSPIADAPTSTHDDNYSDIDNFDTQSFMLTSSMSMLDNNSIMDFDGLSSAFLE